MHRRHLLKALAAATLVPISAHAREAAASPPAVRCVRVGVGPVPLRAEPALGGGVIAMAPSRACGAMRGETATVVDGFRWVRLTLDDTGVTGWVPTWHLAAVDS